MILRGDVVKDDSANDAVWTEQGASASHVTAAKTPDVISRLPGCSGKSSDAASAYTQSKRKTHQNLLIVRKKIVPSFSCQCMLTTWRWQEKLQNMPKMWATLQKQIHLDDSVFVFNQVYLGCTHRAAQVNNRNVMGTAEIWSRNWSAQAQMSQPKRKIPKTSQLGATTCKVGLKRVLNVKANWCARRVTNYTKFAPLAWTITK